MRWKCSRKARTPETKPIPICVPAWLNEVFCGKTDFELWAKIWTKVKFFKFWYISSIAFIVSSTITTNTFFQWKWQKKGVMEHLLADWQIGLHYKWPYIFLQWSLYKVVLNNIIHDNVQHIVTLDRNIHSAVHGRLGSMTGGGKLYQPWSVALDDL